MGSLEIWEPAQWWLQMVALTICAGMFSIQPETRPPMADNFPGRILIPRLYSVGSWTKTREAISLSVPPKMASVLQSNITFRQATSYRHVIWRKRVSWTSLIVRNPTPGNQLPIIPKTLVGSACRLACAVCLLIVCSLSTAKQWHSRHHIPHQRPCKRSYRYCARTTWFEKMVGEKSGMYAWGDRCEHRSVSCL